MNGIARRWILWLLFAGPHSVVATRIVIAPPPSCTDIFEALNRGSVECAWTLIETDPRRLEECDSRDRTPLHMAAARGQEWIVELFLARSASVNITDKDGWTPLHWAAAAFGEPITAYHEIVKMLVQHGADLRAAASDGKLPIDIAAERGDKIMVEALTPEAQGADADAQSLLVAAARVGEVETAKTALDRLADPNGKDREGLTPLRIATLRGHLEVAKLLLDRGAKVDIFAAVALNLTNEVVRLLRMNPNLRNAESADEYMEIGPPLHFAAQRGNLPMVELLLSQGVEIDGKGPLDMTPLHWAALMGHEPVVAFLLMKGAEINRRDVQGKTALGWTVLKGHHDVAEFLRQRGGRE